MTIIGAAKSPDVAGIIVFIGYILIYADTAGISLDFPAAVIGKPMNFLESWRASKGNTWSMFGTNFLVAVPIVLVIGIASTLIIGHFSFDIKTEPLPNFVA